MCKSIIALALLAVAVYSAPAPQGSPPTVEQAKAELTAAGISTQAVDGIVDIGEKHKDEIEAAKNDHEAMKTALESLKQEVDTYMKTQSEADQTAYNAFVEKKKAEFESHASGAPSQ